MLFLIMSLISVRVIPSGYVKSFIPTKESIGSESTNKTLAGDPVS